MNFLLMIMKCNFKSIDLKWSIINIPPNVIFFQNIKTCKTISRALKYFYITSVIFCDYKLNV